MVFMPSVRTSLLALSLAVPALAVGWAVAQSPAPAAPEQAAPAPAPNKVVARVDGVEITEGDLAVAAEDPALQIPGVAEAQKRDLLIGYLIDMNIGARAAEDAKVG